MELDSPIYAYWNLLFVNQLFLWPYRILFFFPPYAQSLTFAFFISLFHLFLFIPIFLALSSHHFILATLFVSHFIFHKWQEQYVWYPTTHVFYNEIWISWFFFHWKVRSIFSPLEPKQTCVTASASKIQGKWCYMIFEDRS